MNEKINILLVDDKPENLLALEGILESPELNLIKAMSGNEALALVLEYDFALVLLDVQMPDIDGFETAELMRGNDATKHIPIIFLTAISKEEKHIFKGYESGAVDYLFKPLEPEILTSKVKVFLDLHRRTKLIEKQAFELQSKQEELQSTINELQETKDELVEKAHKAGMADVATSVLHNVGNILNSVNICTSVIRETLANSKLDGLVKANDLLRDNQENIEDFIINNPKGKKLIRYYLKLEEFFRQEHSNLMSNTNRLKEKVNAISDVIIAQQTYAKGNFFSEKLSLSEIVEDAINLQSGSLTKHDINSQKKFSEVPEVPVQKSKLIHILLNLYKNAKEAMADIDPSERKLIIEIDKDAENAYIKVSDAGCGIKKENLQQIFVHGFTTKENGHGFGLHSCANYMSEMGGKMWVESDGVGKGATFVLSFPLNSSEKNDSIHVVDEDEIDQIPSPTSIEDSK